MARIETYNRSVGLQAPTTLVPQLSSAVGQELSGLGTAVQQVAAVVQDRAQQRENFQAENDYRRLKLDLQRDLEERSRNITEGGAGFHDTYMNEVFKPRRDAFMQKVPERLRPQFQAILNDDTGADAEQWSISAATVERDESYRWQKQEINTAQEEMANGISMSPEAYDGYLEEGNALIEASNLPTSEQALLKQQWERMAQVAMLNQLLQTDPEGVIRELGGDARNLSPTTQFAMLSRAVQWQESRDNPNAVSGKGAVGLMQVMPSTAADIAKEIGDSGFPTGASESVVRAYLSNPIVNKRYGEYYLRQQLRNFANTRNPIETALVAYNAGPGVAQKWVESGYDDRVLAKETRDYKRTVMASLTSPSSKGSPKDVKFVGAAVDSTNPELRNRVADAYATLGLGIVKVNSAERSEAHNKDVGGASGSQHLSANALDIDVSGMKIADRIELIKSLSAAGVTGIGVYSNTIHADLGGRRAWGPDHGSGSVPKWASGVIAEHLAGTTPPPRAVNTRYASMPYDTVQSFLTKADTAVTAQRSAAVKTSAVEKVEVKRSMDNELAMIRATGAGSGSFDETRIATVLGEDEYMTFSYRKDVAQRTYTAKDGIAQMSPEDMEQRFKEYAPVPGSSDFAAQQEVQAAVQKEIDRVTTLRAKQPDQAALEYPEVAAAYSQLTASMQDAAPAPNEVQSFVRLMLETQAGFDVAPDARAPVPHDWALEIGRALGRVPEATGRNLAEQRASVVAQYTALQEVFGDYTDEVLSYALSEYKGLSKPMADILAGYVTQLRTGTGAFRPKDIDAAADREAVDSFSSFDPYAGRRVLGPLLGSSVDSFNALSQAFRTGTQTNDGMSPEEQLRATNATTQE